MVDFTDIAAIPEPVKNLDSLLEVTSALKQTVEALTGQRGGDGSTVVTQQDLTDQSNLAGVDPTVAKDNLQLGSAADLDDADVFQVANDLSEGDPTTMRTNLGLGTAAVEDVGVAAGNVIQLDGTPKLPAVDGSALTNLAASQGASVVLLQSQSVSGVATIDFVHGTGGTVLDDTYDRYELRIEVTPATDDVEMRMRVGTGAGPTYQADAADYSWHTMYMAGGASAVASDLSDNEMVMSAVAGSAIALGNAAAENYVSEVKFCNPELAASSKHFYWSGSYNDAGGVARPFWGGGQYLTAEAITAVRFLTSSGNISGRISLYAHKKA
jgi:hypothetical protein